MQIPLNILSVLDEFEQDIIKHTTTKPRDLIKIANSLAQMGVEDPKTAVDDYRTEWKSDPEADRHSPDECTSYLAHIAIYQAWWNRQIHGVLLKHNLLDPMRRVLRRDQHRQEPNLEGFGRIVKHSYGMDLLLHFLSADADWLKE